MKKFLSLFISLIIVSSCSSDYEILDSLGAIILTADNSIKTINEEVTFTVKDNEGNDITAESVIYINGEAIEGNSFTSSTVGEFTVTAVSSGITSEPLTIRFHDGSEINFNKRVLIEDYTGTWCGYCPRVAFGIEQAKEQSDNVVAVAIHRASLNPNDPSYDPYTFDSGELEDFINIPGYPKGLLNRVTQWNYPEPNNINQVIALTQGENPKMGLAMTSSVSDNTISLDVNVKFGKDFSNELKLVVYVLENGLIHYQHNYTTYYDGIDPIPAFEHNHVLRECLTPLMGENIPGNEASILNVYTKSFNIAVPATIENANNIEFVAFVTDAAGNTLNVRSAHPNEEQDFEEL